MHGGESQAGNWAGHQATVDRMTGPNRVSKELPNGGTSDAPVLQRGAQARMATVLDVVVVGPVTAARRPRGDLPARGKSSHG